MLRTLFKLNANLFELSLCESYLIMSLSQLRLQIWDSLLILLIKIILFRGLACKSFPLIAFSQIFIILKSKKAIFFHKLGELLGVIGLSVPQLLILIIKGKHSLT